MRKIAVVTLTMVVAVLMTGCGGGGEDALITELPAGMDFYLTVSPEKVGMARILEAVEESGLGGEPQLAAMGAALGFDPLDWDEWVGAMGLDPQGEIGFAGYMAGGEMTALALFLPVTDSQALQSFLELVPEEAPMEAGQWREGWWAVYFSEVPQQLQSIMEGAAEEGQLGEDPDFDSLWPAVSGPEAVAYMYLRAHGENDLEALLLSLEVDGTVARTMAAIVPSENEMLEGMEVMTRGPSGSEPGLPTGMDVVARSTVDMGAVADMASEQMPPDANQGLAMMGFDSIDDMLGMFSGDSWAAVDLSGESVRGLVVIGLDDAEAMAGFLSRLSGFAAMGGQEIETIAEGGVTGYRIPLPPEVGPWPLEIGVSNSGLFILWGYSLGDVSGWSAEPASHEALGIDHQAPLYISGDLTDLRRHLPPGAEEFMPSASRFAISMDADGDALVLQGALDTGSDNPLAEVFTGFLAGMSYGMPEPEEMGERETQ